MELLISIVIKSLLLAGVALGLLGLLRRSSAAARSVVAHLALLALVLLPVATLLLPPLQIAVTELPDVRALPVLFEGPLTALSSTAMMPGAMGEIDNGQGMSVENWALLGYAIPAIALLFITLLAIGRLFVLRARASVLVDRIWLRALGHAQRLLGVKHATLLVGDDLPSPVSWGLVRPVVLLDRETLQLHDQAEAIVAHELAHIARFDWAKLLLSQVASALYWFNPLVWILAREAHQLREEAADDTVLAANIIDTDYAQLLLRTARHQFQRRLLTAHGVAPSRHSLTRRVQRVLNAAAARGPATSRFSICMVIGALALAAPLAALSFEASGGATANVESYTLPVGAVKTVVMATARSTDIIRGTIDASPEPLPMQGGKVETHHVEAPMAAVGLPPVAADSSHADGVISSQDALMVIQEVPKAVVARTSDVLATAIPVSAIVEPVSKETTMPLYGSNSFLKVVPISDRVVYLQARNGQWYQATLGKGCRGFMLAIAPRKQLSTPYQGSPGDSFFNFVSSTQVQSPGFAAASNPADAPSPGGGIMHVGSNRPDGNFGRLSVVRVEDMLGRLSCQVESLVEGGPPPGKVKA